MSTKTWDNFLKNYIHFESLGFSLDTSKININPSLIETLSPKISTALKKMQGLEKGEIANPDENRMVGHYWLRNPNLAPTQEIKAAITEAIKDVKDFSKKVHAGNIKGGRGRKFQNVLVIGIGGSALGPQLVSDALGSAEDEMSVYFCDNTDPDGIFRLKQTLLDAFDETICLVVSKSGGTVETKNGMHEFEKIYQDLGLNFSDHAVAVTCQDSKLDNYAKENNWLKNMYMWDWVGGRTSIFSQVGLLPAALQGIDIEQFLEGGKAMDEITRSQSFELNPAMMLAIAWYQATDGSGKKDMVMLPYKDRLMLCSKYLQQLVMESLGKEKDLDGKIVHQGIAVYGNKGSTDQHAYVQQLREGIPNFFVTFVEILKDFVFDPKTNPIEVEQGGITTGDYLHGFFLGTRKALSDNQRESVTITFEELTSKTLGALIALYDRAVGFYANLVNINAYHQPGVEAGKKAATRVIEIQKRVTDFLIKQKGKSFSAEQVAENLNIKEETETVFKILYHQSFNANKNIKLQKGDNPKQYLFGY